MRKSKIRPMKAGKEGTYQIAKHNRVSEGNWKEWVMSLLWIGQPQDSEQFSPARKPY